MKNQPIIVKILVGVAITLLSVSIIGLFSAYTIQKTHGVKIKNIEEDLDDKPSNDVLLQYMELTSEKFNNQQKILEGHINSDDLRFDFHEKEINRIDGELQKIRDKYLTDVYRSTTEKKSR